MSRESRGGRVLGTGTGGGGMCKLELGILCLVYGSEVEVDAISDAADGKSNRRSDGPTFISTSKSISKAVPFSTAISSSPLPSPMTGKLRDPTTSDLPFSLSFTPVVERRKFERRTFSFSFPLRIPAATGPLTSPENCRFFALALSSTFTFSETSLRV